MRCYLGWRGASGKCVGNEIQGEDGQARLKVGHVDAQIAESYLLLSIPLAKSSRRAIFVACSLVAIVWLPGKQGKRSLLTQTTQCWFRFE